MAKNHRNLSARTSMFVRVLKKFLAKNLVKNQLISALYKVVYLKELFFSGLEKLSSLHKIGWRSAEKISPFFKHASSSIAPRISLRRMQDDQNCRKRWCYHRLTRLGRITRFILSKIIRSKRPSLAADGNTFLALQGLFVIFY
jgi:hypothetical protein